MCFAMAAEKSICLFLVLLASTSVFTHSYVPQRRGKRLFGGYRIVPKVCQPTHPSRVKSDEPAICMFNYECSQRNGEVVGSCMDGFLFGACCQLPTRNTPNNPYEKGSTTEDVLNFEQIDHVPDIPILLNPDGTPMGMVIHQNTATVKTETSGVSNHLINDDTAYTKISMFSPSSTTTKPASIPTYTLDRIQNAEKPQIPPQPDVSHLEENFPALLGQSSILDDLSLPGLLTHSDSNNDIQDHQDNSAVNAVTTLLSPDQILQIADPVDQLPALFSQGFGQSNYSAADTILLNENGTLLNETNNPDDLFRPITAATLVRITENKKNSQSHDTTEKSMVTESVTQKDTTQTIHQSSPTSQWIRFPDHPSTSQTTLSLEGQKSTTSLLSKIPVVSQMYTNIQKLTTVPIKMQTKPHGNLEEITTIEERVSTKDMESTNSINQKTTTPMTTLSDKNEDLVRVPTITYDAPSGNKKNDIVDKEEMAINHIISILNDTTPGTGDTSVTVQGPSSSIHTWVSIDETSKPSILKASTTRPSSIPTLSTSQTFPYTFYKPAQPSTYYNYETVPTETSYSSLSTSNTYPSRPSTQMSYGSSSSFGYSTRPTTNPPAPTVIVLGPLGTEYTTEMTEKPVTRRPTSETTKPTFATVKPTAGSIRPSSTSTRKPSVSTTITHNISTVISNVASNNNHVVSTSFITVNLKDGTTAKPTISTDISTQNVEANSDFDEKITTRKPTIWTTLSSWSDKPSFYLKPSTVSIDRPEESLTPVNTVGLKDTSDSTTAAVKATTPTAPCIEDTPAPDDLVNFPPVRNPNLNISVPLSQQEKPSMVETFNNTGYPSIEIISEDDIPTPTFIEDDVLTNKVDVFVNKIVESLQGNFQDLKDIIYNRNESITTAPSSSTKKPTAAPTTTKKPDRRPTSTTKPSTTRKPLTTKRPTTRPTTSKPAFSERPRPPKPTTSRPRPSTVHTVTTKKPQVTTKRTRPTRKPTTTTPATSTEAILEEATSLAFTNEATTTTTHASVTSDLRSQCGVRPLINKKNADRIGKIVGGKAATFGEWPWQVLVREATWLGLFTKNKCGGVLITDKYVLTAAHCQPGFLASLVAVFGEFDLSGELEDKRSVTRNIRRVYVNRAYNPATFENDLALLELESPVQFDDHIVPICMPDDGIDFTGRMATVTGWGRLKYNGGVPSILQEVQVPIMENSVCQEMFQIAGHPKLILESFLCAGYATGQKDSCEGDSGGPLVMQRPDGRWFLVGTVSHGIKCASPYLPGVYMRTTYYKQWLHSITGV